MFWGGSSHARSETGLLDGFIVLLFGFPVSPKSLPDPKHVEAPAEDWTIFTVGSRITWPKSTTYWFTAASYNLQWLCILFFSFESTNGQCSFCSWMYGCSSHSETFWPWPLPVLLCSYKTGICSLTFPQVNRRCFIDGRISHLPEGSENATENHLPSAYKIWTKNICWPFQLRF